MLACRWMVLYCVRTRYSSASSSPGSRVFSRCGRSPLTWPNRVSIQAWSCGVCGRPNCWAVATPARNSRVVTDFTCGPLSEMASSSGICPSPARPCTWSFSPLAIAARSASVAPLVGLIQQVLGVQRGEEAGLDLGRGLLRAGEGGQPLAGDHVQDGDRRAPGAGPVGEVVGHTPLGFSLGI